jgi:hypothetical protein
VTATAAARKSLFVSIRFSVTPFPEERHRAPPSCTEL